MCVAPFYFALRESAKKNVMGPRNSRRIAASAGKREPASAAARQGVGRFGTHESSPGGDGGKPIFRRTGCPGDCEFAKRLGSDGAAGLARRKSVVSSRTAKGVRAYDGQRALAKNSAAFS